MDDDSIRQALLDSDALASRAPRASEAPDAMALRELAAALERDIERDRGLLGRVRAFRTRQRVGAVVALALLPAIAYGAIGKPSAHELAAAAACAIALLGLCSLLLAPLSRPRGHALRRGAAALGLVAPAGTAWLSSWLPSSLTGPSSAAAVDAVHASASACFGMGVLCSVPAFALAQAVARSPLRSGVEVGLLGALSGIAASMALDLHCASQHLQHLLLGHASVGLTWVGLAWIGSAWASSAVLARSRRAAGR